MPELPAPDASSTLRTFDLDFPIVVEGKTVLDAGTKITVRKPGAGELRGLTLLALSQLDYGSLETLAPRITMPILAKPMIQAMDPADIMQLGGEVMDFLLPNAAKQASPEA